MVGITTGRLSWSGSFSFQVLPHQLSQLQLNLNCFKTSIMGIPLFASPLPLPLQHDEEEGVYGEEMGVVREEVKEKRRERRHEREVIDGGVEEEREEREA